MFLLSSQLEDHDERRTKTRKWPYTKFVVPVWTVLRHEPEEESQTIEELCVCVTSMNCDRESSISVFRLDSVVQLVTKVTSYELTVTVTVTVKNNKEQLYIRLVIHQYWINQQRSH